MVEEWCGESDGQLIPLAIVPLWDPALAAAEVRYNAARGVRAITFSEAPYHLGLPSIHDAARHWDPLLAACNETGTLVCMHIHTQSGTQNHARPPHLPIRHVAKKRTTTTHQTPPAAHL